MRFLLDVNALVALAIPKHPFHERVHNWFRRDANRLWATCPLTQGGFLRVATRTLGNSREGMRIALANLDQHCESPHHEFWPNDVDIRNCGESMRARLLGHNQITDLQLLLLAHQNDGQLATLDKGIRELAAGTRYSDAVIQL